MKTQITKILDLSSKDYVVPSPDGDRLALCGAFVEKFFPNEPLPAQIKVTVSLRSWAYKGAKKIWIRHQSLGSCYPTSSWTWEKDGNKPSMFSEGAGMYCYAFEHMTPLLAEKYEKLPLDSNDLSGEVIPVYVRVVKTSK